jgi:hypothetical protein
MIRFVDVLLKDIFQMGRDFPWERPAQCPCCGNWKVWGHGFVGTFFNGFSSEIWLKRYRCPACGCVVKLRPSSHFHRFQSSKHTIRSSLMLRICTGNWPQGSCKSRQRYWLHNLKRQMKAHLNWNTGLTEAFDLLADQGKIPVSSLI